MRRLNVGKQPARAPTVIDGPTFTERHPIPTAVLLRLPGWLTALGGWAIYAYPHVLKRDPVPAAVILLGLHVLPPLFALGPILHVRSVSRFARVSPPIKRIVWAIAFAGTAAVVAGVVGGLAGLFALWRAERSGTWVTL